MRKTENRCCRASRLVLLASAIAGLLLSGGAAPAKVRDGSQLLRQCTATIGAQVAVCFGYIEAMLDTLLLNNSLCMASEPDDAQLRYIVVQFLKTHPDLQGFTAPDAVARALTEAFPCR